jgi:hypothetical protein
LKILCVFVSLSLLIKNELPQSKGFKIFSTIQIRHKYIYMMLRRLQDRLNSATASLFGDGATSESTTMINRLTDLGFSREEASGALSRFDGNVDRAAEHLLSNNHVTHQQNNYHRDANAMGVEDQELQRAIEQSALDYNNNNNQRQKQQQQQQHRTAAMQKAAEAALLRNQPKSKKKTNPSSRSSSAVSSASSSRTTSPVPSSTIATTQLKVHHPDVKLIPKLQDKDIEEQILRTTDRMKNYPLAVDTLETAIRKLREHPAQSKYRRIDQNNSVYQNNVANVPGTTDFLRAMKFRLETSAASSVWILDECMIDPALLFLGWSALEQTKQTTEYKTAKQNIEFQNTIQSMLLNTSVLSAEEMTKRNDLAKRVPKEPQAGGAWISVELGLSKNGNSSNKIRRKFDADDTVLDVIHWVGSHHPGIYDRIVAGSWFLQDLNQKANQQPLSGWNSEFSIVDSSSSFLSKASSTTLQSAGWWPAGRLALRPN